MTGARSVVAAVRDPELRVVTIDDLGILRSVREGDGRVAVTITPTYSGCPAMDAIRDDITTALHAAGFPSVVVDFDLSRAWSTDWITEAGRAKLAAAGIVPPSPTTVTLTLSPRCPHCASPDTERLSRFGSTACKALWRCRACREPFEQVKAL